MSHYNFEGKTLSLKDIKKGIKDKTLPLSILAIEDPVYSITPLIEFFDTGDEEDIKKWIELGSTQELNLYFTDICNTTIFNRAIEEGHLEIVKALHKKEPNFINQIHKMKKVNSPFTSAIVCNQKDMLLFLLDIHTHANVKIDNDKTILDVVIDENIDLADCVLPYCNKATLYQAMKKLVFLIKEKENLLSDKGTKHKKLLQVMTLKLEQVYLNSKMSEASLKENKKTRKI